MGYRDNNSDKSVRIKELENIIVQKDKAMETQRILMQDKIDQCQQEKYDALKDMFEQTEDLKLTIKNLK